VQKVPKAIFFVWMDWIWTIESENNGVQDLCLHWGGSCLGPRTCKVLPHIKRANYIAMRDKSYHVRHPALPQMKTMTGRWRMACTHQWDVLFYQLLKRSLNSPSVNVTRDASWLL